MTPRIDRSTHGFSAGRSPFGRLFELLVLVSCCLITGPLAADAAAAQSPPRTAAANQEAANQRTDNRERAGTSNHGREHVRVFAYTLEHQKASDAIVKIRPLLSSRGTVEEQPRSNTLVVRDVGSAVEAVARALNDFDRPPEALRFQIQVLQAGPKARSVISPPRPGAVAEAEVSAELVDLLKGLLRYEDYRVLAQAGVTSQEGDEVVYSLGDGYDVSFRLGSILGGQRLKLEGFRIREKTRATSKGPQLPPRDLFNATLNLWLDKPFTLVLAQDEERKEALMVAISCHREATEPDAEDD